MLKVKAYSVKGTKAADVTLPKSLEAGENLALLSQAIHVYRHRSHGGVHAVKTRADVNRTKKKVYKQKGTGGARHGARSAPIYVGGGVAHGPKALKKELTLPQNMRSKALAVALSLAAKEDKVLAASGFDTVKKTTDVKGLLKNLQKGSKTLFALSDKNFEASRALKNLKGAVVKKISDINAYDVFVARNVVLDKDAFETEKPASKAKTKPLAKKAVKKGAKK